MTTPQGQAPEEIPTEEQPTQGQEPGADESAPDVDALQVEIKKLRREAASWRTKLRQAEEAEAARERAEMTELERVKADLESERQARAQAEEQRQAQLVRTQVITAAVKLEFEDPEDAMRYLDLSALEVDEAGAVDGLDAALQALAKAKPYLIKTTAGTISPTNPAGGRQAPSSDQMKREYLYGRASNVFDGGGVVWPE